MPDFVTRDGRPLTPLPALTIGGSQAAAAVGLDPFCSRVRLWAELTGKVQREEPGEWALWGNLLEPVIVQRANDLLPSPEKIVTGLDEWGDERHLWMRGHTDGLVVDRDALDFKPLGVAEIKTTGPFRGFEWKDEAAPPQYVIQCHWYMRLTGLDWSLLACLIGGQRLELRRIERDPEIEALMLAAAEEFVGYCERDEPPPPDGSDSTSELLATLFPQAHEGVSVEATAEDYQAVLDLAKVKAQRKAVEQEEARLENVLKLRLGDAERLDYEGRTVARWPLIHGERKPQAGGPYSYRRFTIAKGEGRA